MTNLNLRQSLLAIGLIVIYILAVYGLISHLGTGLVVLGSLPVLYIGWSMGVIPGVLAWGVVMVFQSHAIMLHHHAGWIELWKFYTQPGSILGHVITLILVFIFAQTRSLLHRLHMANQRQTLISQLSQEALKEGSLSNLMRTYLPAILQSLPGSRGLATVSDQAQKQMLVLNGSNLPGFESGIILTAEEKQWLMTFCFLEITPATGSNVSQGLLHKVGAPDQGRVHILSLKTSARLYGMIMLFTSGVLTGTSKQFIKTLGNILSNGMDKQEHRQKLVHDYEQLLHLFDSLDAVACVVDPVSDEVLYVNKKASDQLPSSEAHSPCYRFLYGQEAPCSFCTNQILFGKEQHDTYHWEMRHPLSGEWYHYTDQALQWADGRWVKFSVAIKITAIKEAQLKEQEQHHFLETLIEAIPGPVFYKDRKGVYLGCNQAFVQFLGIDKEAIIGKSLFDFYPLDLAQTYNKADEDLYKSGGSQIYEAPLPRRDGTLRTVVFHKAVLTNSEGEISGLVGVILDITERKQLEAERLQNQKLTSIGQLAAGIAHEINTPIQFIGDNVKFLNDAFTDLMEIIQKSLEAAGADPANLGRTLQDLSQALDVEYLQGEIPQAVAQTLEGVNRVSQIVKAMKAFAHPEGQESTMTNVNEVIANTVVVSKNEWKYVAWLQTHLDPKLPMVPALPGELGQVILNIIVNAAHAIEEKNQGEKETKGLIQVTTSTQNGSIEISIADNGMGMPPEVQEKIFDPFFTTKPVGKGTGQGLAIAYAVIHEKHKGKIMVSSTPGQGTTFSIILPLTVPSSSPADQALSSNTKA